MPELATFDARTDSAETIAACVEQRAYAIVHNLLNADELARVKGELDPHIESVPLDGTPFLGAKTKRLSGLFTKSKMIQQMAIHPLVLGVADLMKGRYPAFGHLRQVDHRPDRVLAAACQLKAHECSSSSPRPD